ncbi:MAG: hypothetical protein ACREFN_04475 [Acetobacteraceae bacterium]
MPDDGAETALRLCRHMHTDGVRLCLRYCLSDGSYVGEIDIAAKGEAAVWQMLAYDLLSVTSAAAERRAVPEPGDGEPVMVHTA